MLQYFIGLFLVHTVLAQGPIVSTLSGDVLGKVMYDPQDRRYEEYLGIPYVQAPIGDFRFSKPEIPLPWSSTKDATEFGNACIQMIAPIHQIIGLSPESEDCLFVNVHVPGGVDVIGSDLKPVIVWIYGGAWYVGTSDMYPGQDLALNGDVVVVSFNYRLNALGWLSTENDAAPGNWGLWDGYYALQWVQANIERFGGDPTRVTLMGQSAGSASVSHHLNSPYSKFLFQRAILLSGSSGSWFASTAYAAESARKLALPFLCPTHSDSAMLSCMRERDATAIDFMSLITPVVMSGVFPNFVPVVDDDFVPQHPRDSIAAGGSMNHDVLVGFTRDDGAGLLTLNPLGMGYGKLLNVANTQVGLRAVLRLAMGFYDNADDMVDILYELYPEMDDFNTQIRTEAASQLLTDFLFGSHAYNEAHYHAINAQSTGKKTWMYEYAYAATFLKYESWINGSHVDDIHTVFGEPFLETLREMILRTEWNDDDRAVRDHHQKAFANFAYTGDPNDGPHTLDFQWPEYTPDDEDYLLLGRYPEAKNLYTDEPERMEKYLYFTEVWPTLIQPRSSYSTLNSIGMGTETVKTALDSILDGIDMEEANANPVTKFWVKLLADLRSRIYVE